MEGEEAPNLEGPPLQSKPPILSRPINSSSIRSSEPDFLRNVQAAFKRHRSIGSMHPSSLLPRRSVPPQREASKSSSFGPGLTVETKRSLEAGRHTNERSSDAVDAQEDASFTPPSMCGSLTNTYDEKSNPFGGNSKEDRPGTSSKDVDINVNVVSHAESENVRAVEGSKKVQFSLGCSAVSQGADDRMVTRVDNLSSLLDSLALTEMEWDAINPMESSNVISVEPKHQNPPINPDGVSRADGASSVMSARMSALQNQLHHLRNFLQNDGNHPITQSSIAGSSSATTTYVHATSAPMPNSTTHASLLHQDGTALGSLANENVPSQSVALEEQVQPASSSSMVICGAIAERVISGAQASSCNGNMKVDVKDIQQSNLPPQSHPEKDPSQSLEESSKDKAHGADISNVPQSCPSSRNLLSDVKAEGAKPEKQEKQPSRKKGYDPDLFFKVNGKLYQRLGKIGSGGSSEVHKVISSDCTIYALKKIKLKGRDYATAFGFCQEILYLKKLKGKNHIIQLIDYEVTDKALLQEVMNDAITNKDSRVKDDGYIYMVLEYGEIDLAHMLSKQWKEVEGSNATINENWLRFYWQQILQAVNTIHEERIVHSDLKPANFLLVKGSLKLIDFGIAKAIMSDTTNIQRDSQVGTLSYMSPEAFMCNESDDDGNIIKCGRPSDIWSLGCILYQMVYGRTPFADYKTFWAKFKVITDPNHEITYAPLSNPWLLDLMKKCLAWDRSKRWRIPQLLQHPFLVPPVPLEMSHPLEQKSTAIQLIAESCTNNDKASTLCSELQQLLGDPTSVTGDQQFTLLSRISSICQQLQEHIGIS